MHPALRGAALSLSLALLPVAAASAQFLQEPSVPKAMLSNPVLQPPPGAKVAIVEFADLECPACRSANPILISAVAKYHVVWQRHDLLIPLHNWSAQAALYARWFDTKSKELGEAYRNSIFEQQPNIATKGDLDQVTQKFAKDHNIGLPFVLDPQGKLQAEIDHDRDLGHELNISRTPTIFVVTRGGHGSGYPVAQVTDPSMLSTYLDQAEAATTGPAPGATRARK